MKGAGIGVTAIMTGLRTDIDRLMERFKLRNELRWRDFAYVFREVKFSLFWCGRTTENELREFSEKAMIMALEYCTSSEDIQQRVCALYLLYSFYYLQPTKFRMKIRITLEQIQTIQAFLSDIFPDDHYDAQYVVHKLFLDHAFHVCYSQDDVFNLLRFKRYDTDLDVSKRSNVVRADRAVVNSVVNGEVVRQVMDIHAEYQEKKRGICGGEPSAALNMVKDCPAKYVREIAKECEGKMERRIFARQRTTSERGSSSAPSRVKDRRAELKAKAYSGLAKQAKHRRHRQQLGGEAEEDGQEAVVKGEASGGEEEVAELSPPPDSKPRPRGRPPLPRVSGRKPRKVGRPKATASKSIDEESNSVGAKKKMEGSAAKKTAKEKSTVAPKSTARKAAGGDKKRKIAEGGDDEVAKKKKKLTKPQAPKKRKVKSEEAGETTAEKSPKKKGGKSPAKRGPGRPRLCDSIFAPTKP